MIHPSKLNNPFINLCSLICPGRNTRKEPTSRRRGRDGLDSNNILTSKRLRVPRQRTEVVSLVERERLLQAEAAEESARQAAEVQFNEPGGLDDEPRGLDAGLNDELDELDELDGLYVTDRDSVTRGTKCHRG